MGGRIYKRERNVNICQWFVETQYVEGMRIEVMSGRKVGHVPGTLLACLKFPLSNTESGCGNLSTKHDDSDSELRRNLQPL